MTRASTTKQLQLLPGAAVSMTPGRGDLISRGHVVSWTGGRVTVDWSTTGLYQEDPEDLTEEDVPCGTV